VKINREHGFALGASDRLQFNLVDQSPQRLFRRFHLVGRNRSV
jgi:hypothetical protein